MSLAARRWMQRALGCVAIFGFTALTIGCGSKDPAATATSASAVPASAAPASAAAAAPTIKIKAVYPEFDGEYDGSKALFERWSSGKLVIHIPKDCPQFSCDHFDRDDFVKLCPKGLDLEIEMESPKVGKTNQSIFFLNAGGSNGIDKVDIDVKTLSDGEVSATLSEEDKDTSAKGSFVAKLCKMPP